MKILVDSSAWIAYFRGDQSLPALDWGIEENLVVTNEIILSELIPPILLRGERKLSALLRNVECIPLTIDWEDLIRLQTRCLRLGINKVGIPDLIIAQHAMQHDLLLFSLDTHFHLISKHRPLTHQPSEKAE
jgi:predicted nucleic acid-binding protein